MALLARRAFCAWSLSHYPALSSPHRQGGGLGRSRRSSLVVRFSTTEAQSSTPSISTPTPIKSRATIIRARVKKTLDARKYLRGQIFDVGKRLGIVEPRDWYRVTLDQFLRKGGVSLLQTSQYSISTLIRKNFSEFLLDPNLFEKRPLGPIWASRSHVLSFLNFVGDSLGIKDGDFQGWYKVTSADLKQFGGAELLKRHESKLSDLLKYAFPEHTWEDTQFAKEPNFWSSKENQRQFLLNLGLILKITPGDYKAWYKVSKEEIIKHGGGRLMTLYHSRYKLLSALLQEYEWHPWLFSGVRRNVNRFEAEGLRKITNYIEKELNIKSPEDWHTVTRADLERLGLYFLFLRQADFVKFLELVYPNVKWDVGKMAWTSMGWSQLLSSLTQLFKGEPPIPAAKFFPRASPKEVDLRYTVVFPNYRLIFDYQGPSVYSEQLADNRPIISQIERKPLLDLALKESFDIISVPFWWDRSRKSLLGEIAKVRPSLFEPESPFSVLARAAEGIPKSIPLPNINQVYIKPK